MHKFSIVAISVLAFLPAPALAASCGSALAAPANGELNQGRLVMTTLDRTGIATYSEGLAVYRPALTRPGLPPGPARWLTPSDKPANLYRDIGKTLRALDPPPPKDFTIQSVSISMTVAAKPTVTVRFLDTGVTHSFVATCSTGGIIHGTSPVIDVLIHLARSTP